MNSFDLSVWVVPIIAVGYLIFGIFRLVLHRKLKRERKAYEDEIKGKMEQLQTDISNRSRDLHDSIQMINQEYSQLMKSMGVQQKQQATQLRNKIKDYQKHMRKKKTGLAKDKPSDPPKDSGPDNGS